MRFSMMWLSVLHQNVARFVESDLPRERHMLYPLLYIFHSTNWLAPVSTQAGMFLNWSAREQSFVARSIWYKRV